MNLQIIDKEGATRGVNIDHRPDECPVCHHSIDPVNHYFAFYNAQNWDKADCLQLVYRCPRLACQKVFISNFKPFDQGCSSFRYSSSQPVTKTERNFGQVIMDISTNFCLIYNQAYQAEQDGLLEICGVGYRKALEFLIKDYLIKKLPAEKATIEKKYLGNCIEDHIGNENIKTVAKRAVWLGNDETHYLRKWEGKDLQDLKKLIDLTIHWFEMEKLTEQIEIDMPENAPQTTTV